MKVTAPALIRSSGLAAVLAGLMFVVIQPLHPADALASVSTDAWAIIHYATLVMLLLFVVGITGMYARQVQRLGWLGLAGFVALSLGLLLTAAGAVIEVFVAPLLVESQPEFVHGFLGMVMGHPTGADLGAIPMLWSAASAGFLGGTLLFGAANFRAGILSRWASAIFTVGLFASAPVAALLNTPRVAAVPIGIGLAWMGYSLWSEQRQRSAGSVAEVPTPRPQPVAAP